MSLEGSSEVNTALSYKSDDATKPHIESAANSYPDVAGISGTENEPLVEKDVAEQKRAAKIHDFCFGIPFGECASSSCYAYLFIYVCTLVNA